MKDWIMTYYKIPSIVEREMTSCLWLHRRAAIYLELGFKSQGWRSEAFLHLGQHCSENAFSSLQEPSPQYRGSVIQDKKGVSFPLLMWYYWDVQPGSISHCGSKLGTSWPSWTCLSAWQVRESQMSASLYSRHLSNPQRTEQICK